MFVFQSYAQKPQDSEEHSDASLGIKKKKPLAQGIMAEALPGEISAAKADIDAVFRKKGVSEFLTTLTPGAQNAIYAASFAWGYENAAKYVKNAMKLEEVKDSLGSTERSKAVVESVQSQSQSEQPETVKETSKFVWGFYNDDLKETQANAAKTEHISEKQRTAKQELVIPATVQQAVAASLAEGSSNPALLYCTSAQQAVESSQEERLSWQKKEELARLVVAPRERQKIAALKESMGGKKKAEIEAEISSLALERRQEVLEEYEHAEKKLEEAIKALDQSPSDEREELKKIARMLPAEISKLVLRRDTLLAKRKAMRAQLVKWLAFSKDGRDSLLSMSTSKLLKLVSLSSLLKIGK